MSFIRDIIRSLGQMAAQDLQKRIQDGMTDTAIIDEESIIPQFDNGKDYTNYPRGFAVRDAGQVYGLLQPYNASYYPQRPAELPALWGLKHTKNPVKAKPYVAPSGTSGMYMTGECCLFGDDDAVYRSKVDNNVYSPAEYAQNWEAVEL